MQRIRYWALRNRKNLINIGWAALCFGSLFGILTIQLSATEELVNPHADANTSSISNAFENGCAKS